jgi:cytochrome b
MAASDPDGDRRLSDSHVRVWDLPTRVFHWTVVLLVAISWLSADRGWMTIHLWSGLILLTLLLFRVIWGFIGSTTARFSNFITPPSKVLGYLKALATAQKPLYAGHNPAGGLMVVALVTVLLAQVSTGLVANDGLYFNGPLAKWVTEENSDRLTHLHGIIFNFLLLLIWCHVVAVGFYWLVKSDNLIGAMITGDKDRNHVPRGLNIRFTSIGIAILVAIFTSIFISLALNYVSNLR